MKPSARCAASNRHATVWMMSPASAEADISRRRAAGGNVAMRQTLPSLPGKFCLTCSTLPANIPSRRRRRSDARRQSSLIHGRSSPMIIRITRGRCFSALPTPKAPARRLCPFCCSRIFPFRRNIWPVTERGTAHVSTYLFGILAGHSRPPQR